MILWNGLDDSGLWGLTCREPTSFFDFTMFLEVSLKSRILLHGVCDLEMKIIFEIKFQDFTKTIFGGIV